jgi:pilus assembly protein Flp/PilA
MTQTRRNTMNDFKHLLHAIITDESGQDLVEYALLGAVIALGAVSSIKSVATGVKDGLSAISTSLTTSV